MGNRSEFALSLGKTAAQITADFAGVPGLGAAVELLCGIIQLCENVSSNRHAAIQLRDRCHTLLLAFNDSKTKMPTPKMTEALHSINDCLLDIQTKMDGWAKVSQIQGFTSQRKIKHDIEYCHASISDCLSKFDLVSHMEIHEWQHDFALNHKRDHDEVMEYLAEIQNSQQISSSAVAEDRETLRKMMGMMQQLLTENVEARDRTSAGLSNNLYDIQSKSRELLPDMNLRSGEVQRIGSHPVSGSAAMDIYEGLYLGREKVAIKIIRAVNSNEQSLRRFKREVQIWSEIWKIDHGEHVLPFYGFCQNDGPYPYMVSPWQKNGTLISYVKRNDSEVDYKRLIKGIAEGIQVLHSMSPPVVHGDIKGVCVPCLLYISPTLNRHASQRSTILL
ncbi:hypothetical protein HGRIS_009644 [Hohenbuehelia grisea]|uniref:Protein kinase domain-containing protein n=1 Tax=Hohenbuehelia grisea TaxID=104357 RepID=A0ABR3J231_9AGAR